jgi:hypothetical protein
LTRLPSHLAFPPDLPLFTPGAATRTPQVGRPSLFLVSYPPQVLDPVGVDPYQPLTE